MAHCQVSGSSRSPARNSVRRRRQSYGASSSPSGSSFLIARIAVGAVNSALHAVLGDHPPERAGVRRADRLALVQDGGRADQQRRVDDVGVADDPADVGGGPAHVARADVVDVRHRPVQRDRVAAVVAHDALGLRRWCPRCRGCRAGRWPRPARSRPAPRRRPARASRGRGPRSSSATACGRCEHRRSAPGWCAASSSARSSSGLYSTTRVGLDAAGRRHDDLRLRVVDPRGQLVRGEAAEDHRVDGAEPRAGQHRDDGLRHHRHVDDDPVALADPERRRAPRRTRRPRRAAAGRCRCASCR